MGCPSAVNRGPEQRLESGHLVDIIALGLSSKNPIQRTDGSDPDDLADIVPMQLRRFRECS